MKQKKTQTIQPKMKQPAVPKNSRSFNDEWEFYEDDELDLKGFKYDYEHSVDFRYF